jgi:hypothetical protein
LVISFAGSPVLSVEVQACTCSRSLIVHKPYLTVAGRRAQVLLSGAEPQQLVALRDAVNAALLRAMGRPLQPLEPNVLALQARRRQAVYPPGGCAA